MVYCVLKVKRLLFLLALFSFLISLLVYINRTPINNFKNSFYFPSKVNTNINFPGSYLQYVHPKPNNISYCNLLNFGFPNALEFDETDLEFGPERQKASPYRILYNVVQSDRRYDIPPVTYATHVTVDFLNYLTELLRYWDGYVSVAAYVTDIDLISTLMQINQLCYCLPEMYRLSLHLVFHYKTINTITSLNLQKPSTCTLHDNYFQQTIRNFSNKDMYPINVCRNAARSASLTKYVLVSDVQLMPSQNLANGFVQMVSTQHRKLPRLSMRGRNRVYVVPVFEIEYNEIIPRTKLHLKQLVRDEKAVYFHRLICIHCQKFPGLENWFETSPHNELRPLVTVKREVPFNRWEPIYIGTKNEPFYNELLSWEGLQDKMPQMLEMCLIGYKFVILDGAFLVHWPGIKKKSKHKEQWRIPYEHENMRQYNKILKQLSAKYSVNSHCKLQ